MTNKNENIVSFWNWFSKNKDIFNAIDDKNRDEKLDLILCKVREVETELSIEISDEFNGIRDLVISPEGDREKFQIVKDIISKSPKIKGWTFTAFRQPVNDDFTLTYKDIEFTPSKMFFYPIIDGVFLDLIIYASDISKHDQNTVTHYGLITMDNLLGEYDCVTKVRAYDFHDLDKQKNRNDLIPLMNLREFVANFHNTSRHK